MGYLKEKTMDKDTKLYSLIGVSALEDGLAKDFNDFFKELDINSKVIPLNIREDDIGFFLNGFKDSQIKAAYFTQEYWTTIASLVEDSSDEVKACQMADTISVVDGKNIADVVYGKAVVELLKTKIDLANSTISFANHYPTSLSIIFNLEKETTKELSLIKKESDVVVDEAITIHGKELKYEEIIKQIAKIKTKEWNNNG